MGDCGVFAVCLHDPDTKKLLDRVYYGGVKIQNRGQHAHGVYLENPENRVYKKRGTLPKFDEFLDDLNDFYGESLEGERDRALLHIRYATSGNSEDPEQLLKNSQPIDAGVVATAHNGQVTNMSEFINGGDLELEGEGDGEIITRLMQKGLESGLDLVGAVDGVYEAVVGGYSVVGFHDGAMFGFRDKYGTKPLFWGRSRGENAFSSGPQNLEGAIQEVAPGELVIVEGMNSKSYQMRPADEKFCAFELAYFANPASHYKGTPIWKIRKELGRQLAREHRELLEGCDYVVPVPKSGLFAAEGMAEELGKEQYHAIIDNQYFNARTFIMEEKERIKASEEKYNFSGDLKGKCVALVDDSTVRGTTLRGRVQALRELGAGEVHVYLTFPYLAHPCLHGGIDMRNHRELVINRYMRPGGTVDFRGLADEFGADSVNYLSEAGYRKALGKYGRDLCLACHNGRHPDGEIQALYTRLKELFDSGVKVECRGYELHC
jgi:amidophosphoribosyltransferase